MILDVFWTYLGNVESAKIHIENGVFGRMAATKDVYGRIWKSLLWKYQRAEDRVYVFLELKTV